MDLRVFQVIAHLLIQRLHLPCINHSKCEPVKIQFVIRAAKISIEHLSEGYEKYQAAETTARHKTVQPRRSINVPPEHRYSAFAAAGPVLRGRVASPIAPSAAHQ
jgi:hypothetical protein